MATVESMNLARLLALEADTVIGGHIDGSGHLILEQHDGSTIDSGYMLASLPDASETVKGKVELATTAEATTGTDTERAVTPAGLAAAVGTLVPDSSTTVKGKVELATDAETATGTDTVRAVTPAALRALLSAMFPVGYIYMATVSTNPNTLFGFGTWSSLGAGRMLISQNGTYTAGSTGGSATATLAEANLPSHTHSFSATTNNTGDHTHDIARDNDGQTGTAEKTLHSTGITSGYDSRYNNQLWPAGDHNHSVSGTTGTGSGSGTSFSTIPPYLAVYMWQRTA